MTEQTHKAGFINIIGNPNVGKSTLMNQLVGERLSIITAKAQTTRHRIRGIVNGENFQIIYSDLPGILAPAYKMQEMMMRFVSEALTDADLILYLVEVGEPKCNKEIIEKLQKTETPVIILINKIDLYNATEIEITKKQWQIVLQHADIMEISALHSQNINCLLDKIIQHLPVSLPFFPKDELTDRPVRFFIAEIIREKILLLYKKEIPYSVEVVIDSFKEENEIVRISAMIYCERETQKGIIIGEKGSAIKRLGIESRKEMETFLEKHIFLDLSVKVLKDWRNQDLMMRRFGYFEG